MTDDAAWKFGDRVQISAPGRHDGKTGTVVDPTVQGGTPGFAVEIDDEGPFFFLPEEIGPIPGRDVLSDDAVAVLRDRLSGILTTEQLRTTADVLDTVAKSRAELQRRLDVLPAGQHGPDDTTEHLRAIVAAARTLRPVLTTLADLPATTVPRRNTL